ncbi:hypothetical protein ARMGADRAFT_1087095 [Armillaria gallica]|uniref:Uncharacterized protein n=1 Tax=Armillaria gallica TaxID=47427 RepID=A0A2H3D343_ARMGA|nr:hypothetical protein ARMGADRAFT_1087095 [Armillaria gallica]
MVQFPPSSENILLKAGVPSIPTSHYKSNRPPESFSHHVDGFGIDGANMHIRIEEQEGPQQNFFKDIPPEWTSWT